MTANAIAPGFIVSDMTRASARRLGRDFDEYQRSAAQSIPVGRVGQPEDIAHAASFLVSPGFVSGQVIFETIFHATRPWPVHFSRAASRIAAASRVGIPVNVHPSAEAR